MGIRIVGVAKMKVLASVTILNADRVDGNVITGPLTNAFTRTLSATELYIVKMVKMSERVAWTINSG